jgi:hypothetical protein
LLLLLLLPSLLLGCCQITLCLALIITLLKHILLSQGM